MGLTVGYIGLYRVRLGLYVGIMENKTETTTLSSCLDTPHRTPRASGGGLFAPFGGRESLTSSEPRPSSLRPYSPHLKHLDPVSPELNLII